MDALTNIKIKNIIKEIAFFFGCRLGTGILDWSCMFVFATKLEKDDVLIKMIANILVIVINYVASKFLIFRTEN